MRWQRYGTVLCSREGEERTRRVFCVLPHSFGNHWYWLQSVNIRERIVRTSKYTFFMTSRDEWEWSFVSVVVREGN